MVAPEDVETVGVLYFEGEEQADGLEALFAAVDVVAEEEVAGIGRQAAVLEQT